MSVSPQSRYPTPFDSPGPGGSVEVPPQDTIVRELFGNPRFKEFKDFVKSLKGVFSDWVNESDRATEPKEQNKRFQLPQLYTNHGNEPAWINLNPDEKEKKKEKEKEKEKEMELLIILLRHKLRVGRLVRQILDLMAESSVSFGKLLDQAGKELGLNNESPQSVINLLQSMAEIHDVGKLLNLEIFTIRESKPPDLDIFKMGHVLGPFAAMLLALAESSISADKLKIIPLLIFTYMHHGVIPVNRGMSVYPEPSAIHELLTQLELSELPPVVGDVLKIIQSFKDIRLSVSNLTLESAVQELTAKIASVLGNENQLVPVYVLGVFFVLCLSVADIFDAIACREGRHYKDTQNQGRLGTPSGAASVLKTDLSAAGLLGIFPESMLYGIAGGFEQIKQAVDNETKQLIEQYSPKYRQNPQF